MSGEPTTSTTLGFDGPRILIRVDPSLSIVEMAKAARCSCFDQDITADHFPVQRPRAKPVWVDLRLVNLRRRVAIAPQAHEIKDALAAEGLRAATLPELLAYVEKYPEGPRTIIALGTVWEDKEGVHGNPRCVDGKYVAAIFFPLGGWVELRLLPYSRRFTASNLFLAAPK